ncbi:MAG: hypothetical protein Q9226_008107 [Calogaya cf. arnoldii]
MCTPVGHFNFHNRLSDWAPGLLHQSSPGGVVGKDKSPPHEHDMMANDELSINHRASGVQMRKQTRCCGLRAEPSLITWFHLPDAFALRTTDIVTIWDQVTHPPKGPPKFRGPLGDRQAYRAHNATMAFTPFFRLPLELRQQVYRSHYSTLNLTYPRFGLPHLLLSSRRLHNEALPLYCENARFKFKGTKQLVDFLTASITKPCASYAISPYEGFRFRHPQPSTWEAMIKERDGPSASVEMYRLLEDGSHRIPLRTEFETIQDATGKGDEGQIEVRIKRGTNADHVQEGELVNEWAKGLHDLFKELSWEEIKEKELYVEAEDDPTAHL